MPSPTSTTKRYKVNFDFEAECHFDIDHAILTTEKVNEISEFWSNHKDRLDETGSALHGVLKMLTGIILRLQIEYERTLEGVIDQFDFKTGNGGLEGWPTLDGTYGIKLVRVDSFYFDEDDMTVETLEINKG